MATSCRSPPNRHRLEGDDAVDRTATVARLRILGGNAAEASALFSELYQLVSRYAPAGATANESSLRRDLSSVARLGRSSTHERGWEILNELEVRLRQRTGQDLSTGPGGQRLRLDRRPAQGELVAAMMIVGSEGRPLVVTGDPDVGKSALALSAEDQLISEGQEVLALNLRDLPPSVS